MKKKIQYSDEHIGEIQIVKDFLPDPSQLVAKEETVKVTMALSKSSILFFKKEAKQHHTHYQTMIRNLLDLYSKQFVKKK